MASCSGCHFYCCHHINYMCMFTVSTHHMGCNSMLCSGNTHMWNGMREKTRSVSTVIMSPPSHECRMQHIYLFIMYRLAYSCRERVDITVSDTHAQELDNEKNVHEHVAILYSTNVLYPCPMSYHSFLCRVHLSACVVLCCVGWCYRCFVCSRRYLWYCVISMWWTNRTWWI